MGKLLQFRPKGEADRTPSEDEVNEMRSILRDIFDEQTIQEIRAELEADAAAEDASLESVEDLHEG